MIRVVAKVHSITLRIKEGIHVQICIRKGHQYISCQEKSPLVNCQAQFQTKMEFFIHLSDPTFNVEIILFQGNNKKFGGSFSVNLNQFNLNSNVLIQQKLTSSPDPQGKIKLQLLYSNTTLTQNNKKLMSRKQMSVGNQSAMQSDMQDRNNFLEAQNARLNLILQNLKNDNRGLTVNKRQVNDFCQQNKKRQENSNKSQCQNQMEGQESSVSDSLKEMKGNMDRMRDLMNEFGSENMKSQMNDFFDNGNSR